MDKMSKKWLSSSEQLTYIQDETIKWKLLTLRFKVIKLLLISKA
jgi:hypothetical protein